MADTPNVSAQFHVFTNSWKEATKDLLAHWQQTPAQSDYVLFAPDLPLPIKGTTAEDIAKAFGVPLELIAPTCVNQTKPPEPEPETTMLLASGGFLAPNIWGQDWDLIGHLDQDSLNKLLKTYDDSHLLTEHWDDPASDPLGDVQKAVEIYKQAKPMMSPITQIAIDLAINGEAIVIRHEDGTISHWDPEPGAPYLKGDGDPGSSGLKISFQANAQHFDVLGKSQPVVSMKPCTIWENDLGRLKIENGRAFLNLTGTVSTAEGSFYLGAELITEDIELAKRMIGVIPNDGPGTGIQVLEQEAGNQLFTWEAGTGWVPTQSDYGPLHASFPAVPTKKGGVQYTWPADGTQHTGPDGAVWEFHPAGGWRVVEYPSVYDPKKMAPYGWFCTACNEHWTVHKGDPVGCDSGGWLRPATSAEHKRALLGH